MVSAAFVLLTTVQGSVKKDVWWIFILIHTNDEATLLRIPTSIYIRLSNEVSTLAVHGKHVVTVSLPSGCEGKTLCDQKPADYPQKEIDWLLKRDHKNLTFLHRTRRDVGKETLVLQPGSTDGNCVTEVEMVKPYRLTNDGLVPDIIVQSQFFNQIVPQVTCKSPGTSCFKSFIRDGSGTAAKCKPKKIGVKLYVYSTEDRAIKLKDGEIDVDCVCVVE